MSEAVQGALVAGGFGFATLIATLWFNARSADEERRSRLNERQQEQDEWYRRTLFEKRLSAVQDAYAWISRINRAVGNTDPKTPNEEVNERLRQMCRDARDWYDSNVLYLADGIPTSSDFIGLTNAAYDHASGRDIGGGYGVQKHLTDAFNWIKNRAENVIMPRKEN